MKASLDHHLEDVKRAFASCNQLVSNALKGIMNGLGSVYVEPGIEQHCQCLHQIRLVLCKTVNNAVNFPLIQIGTSRNQESGRVEMVSRDGSKDSIYVACVDVYAPVEQLDDHLGAPELGSIYQWQFAILRRKILLVVDAKVKQLHVVRVDCLLDEDSVR